MNTTRLIWTLTIALLSFNNGGCWGTGSESTIESDIPAMPLLATWIDVVNTNQMRLAGNSPQAFTSQPMIDTRHKYASITRFDAKLYNDESALVVSSDDREMDASARVATGDLYYVAHNHVWHSEWNPLRDGGLRLEENKGDPLAISVLPLTDSPSENLRFAPGRPVTLRPAGTGIQLGDWMGSSVPAALHNRYYEAINPHDGDTTLICDELSGQTIAVTPKIEEFDHSRTLAARRVGSRLVLGGMEGTRSGGQELLWCIRENNTNKWITKRTPLNAAYLQSVLPKPLWVMSVDDQEQRVKVWKDGSIIFRLECSAIKENDELQVSLLVRQRFNGTPDLLSWEVHHDRLPDASSFQGVSRVNAEAAEGVFNHVWYPGEGGRILSNYTKTMWRNDMCFDTDIANECVIYLIGGRVWVVHVSDHR